MRDNQPRPYFGSSGINRAENIAQLAVSGGATAARHAGSEAEAPAHGVEPQDLVVT